MSPEQARLGKESKEKYMRLFMIDYLEFNLRKVMVENTHFCAEKCSLFEDLRPGKNLPEVT